MTRPRRLEHSDTHNTIQRNVFIVEIRVKLEVLKLKRICRCRLVISRWARRCDDDTSRERATERHRVPVVVLVRPDGGDTLDHGVPRCVASLSGTLKRKCHGFHARLSRDKKEARKDGNTNFFTTTSSLSAIIDVIEGSALTERFRLVPLVVFPQRQFHHSFGSKILFDQVAPPRELKFLKKKYSQLKVAQVQKLVQTYRSAFAGEHATEL
jgi:hypothetical protein